jgi:cysteine desulfurase
MKIYLDNAATTKIDSRVAEAMMPYLTEHFGNPSSLHSFGRDSRSAIEKARKKISGLLGTQPANLFFTSGGTEADNQAIISTILAHKIPRAISSPLEHHAVLQTLEQLHKNGQVELKLLEVDKQGNLNQAQLRNWMEEVPQSFVSLMQANNEIGNMTDIHAVGELCKKYNAIFHSDTVQTVGHFPFDLRNTPVHFITGSGHKFHGPKGSGLLYINENVRIQPFVHGGSQERNMRAGTENLYGIVGFAKALELATAEHEADRQQTHATKMYMMDRLKSAIPAVTFNGDPEGDSLYTVLNVGFPKTEKSEMMLFNLDINHICASGGSACTSGANQGSHVIRAINTDPNRIAVRFSFSRHNTREEIDQVVGLVKTFI